jgi:hypothetical protein
MSTTTSFSKPISTGIESSAQANAVRIAGRTIHLTLKDGRKLAFSADRYPRLREATPQQLRAAVLEVDGEALRWEELDEDILVQDVVEGRFPKPRGGSRPAAGRKPSGRAPFLIRLKPETMQRVRRKAGAVGLSLSEFVEQQLAEV